MSPRKLALIVCVVAGGGLFASCNNRGNNPTAPSNVTSQSANSLAVLSSANLGITGMSVLDPRQGPNGQWLYDTEVYLHAGPGGVSVTKVQVQLYAYSTLLGSASTTPAMLMQANSYRDAGLVVASRTNVSPSALTGTVTVTFTDAQGNVGSVSATFSCFGCWDY
jgi:hypothetical protein